MSHLTLAIAATKTLTLVFGSVITYLSWMAYRRTRADALRALAIGFAVITVGSVIGGGVDLVGDVLPIMGSDPLLYGVLVQSVLTMVGFGFITYSLYQE
ncbi:hypothetical protein Hbl1158_15995 (plasmid) [Halobaculum sp. CBA1158]|uniref:DUF7521 family protein n=1 Tax=Halobaculum sp. CBA1158 TaxID=2904243 RepID=UPI001F16FB6C|nr:hypothetical protein [Halobaculum sp. CBA1158]UIP01409.1 hypothetical protein Hbl1158_15995 [Halobaculum sp. CBA1158]